jgi:hypothetical protein
MPVARPLSRQDIENAIANTFGNKEAARYIHVDYKHFRTYAKMYKNAEGISLYDANARKGGRGKKSISKRERQAHIYIKKLVNGIGVPIEQDSLKIKDVLLRECFLEPKCYHCGFNEERVIDKKAPLLVNFKDKDKMNYKLENLELLCYNCYFLYIGNIMNDKQIYKFEDFIPSSPKINEKVWEISPEQMEALNNMTFEDQDLNIDLEDGSEFISRI